jgi:tripartite ATP-independent transporter DctP family solute receptor
MKKSIFLGLIFTIFISLLLSTCNAKSGPIYTLKFAHDQAVDHAYNLAALYFANKVKEKTGGKVKINVYPNAQLGAEPVMVESLKMGTLDFCINSTSNASAFLPQLGMMSVSYLFNGKDQLKKVAFDKQITQRYQKLFLGKKLGFELLTFMPNGLRNMYSTKEVKSIDDIQGMKMRTMPSPVETRVWTALGTKPTTVPFSEVYTALQTNLVNAAENTVSSYGQSKQNEVAPYYILTGHQWLMTMILASDKTMNKLPANIKKIIQQAAIEAAKYGFDKQLDNDDKYLKELQAKGVKVVKVDRKPFIDRVTPLHAQIAKELGAEDVLKRIKQLK